MTPKKGQRRTDFYNLTELKERGWTAKMVSTLIDVEPTEFWGMYKNRTQKCWEKGYIESLEATDAFKEMLEKASARSASAKARAEAKAEENAEKFRRLAEEMEIPVIPENELFQRSLDSKIAWEEYRADLRGRWLESEDEFRIQLADIETQKRWATNYVRHELTGYEELLDKMAGIVGTGKAYHEVRAVLDRRIKEAYPCLA